MWGPRAARRAMDYGDCCTEHGRCILSEDEDENEDENEDEEEMVRVSMKVRPSRHRKSACHSRVPRYLFRYGIWSKARKDRTAHSASRE
jgi:hypothetical protein